jgi:aspartate/glutamate racemase
VRPCREGDNPAFEQEALLERQVALHDERVEEEKRGVIRWLRPECQIPRFAPADAPASAASAAFAGADRKPVGLPGTKFTMEMDFYTGKLAEHGIDAFVPAQLEVRDYIQQTLRDELGRGVIREETKRAYLGIINQLIAGGAEGIILG